MTTRKERYLLVKECRVEQVANGCLELGMIEEINVAVADRKELVELTPILNDYGNNTKSGRHLPKNFMIPISLRYARELERELERRDHQE